MKNFSAILFLASILVYSYSCTDSKKRDQSEIVIDNRDSVFLPPIITQLNKENLHVVTPGKNGVPLPKSVKMSKPEVHLLRNQPIFPGLSYLNQSKAQIASGQKPIMSKKPIVVPLDKEKLLLCTPGKQGFQLPKVYHIESQVSKNDFRKNYSVQFGDTIYPIIFKTYPRPVEEPASFPKYMDNANKNIQVIGKDEGLGSAIIFSIMEDRHGNIWFGTFGGAVCFDGNSYRTFTVKEGLKNNWVSSIYEDKSGRLWFSHQMANAGVSCYNGQQFCHFTTHQGLSGNAVNSVLEDKKGNIWFGTDNGLTCYNGETLTNYTYQQGLCYNLVLDLLEDKNGHLWIATLGGISIFNGKSFVDLTIKNGFFKANSMVEDKNGHIWFAAYGLGLVKFDGKTFTHYTKEQGLTSNNVVLNNNLLEDREGNIWVGTENGINCFDGKSFTQLTTENGLTNNIITALCEDSGGNIWAGTRGNGVNRYAVHSFTHYTELEGLPHSTVRAIYEDKRGNIWIGTWGGGVSCFDGVSLTKYDLSKDIKGPAHNDIRSIVEDEKGQLWFGTGNGLDCFDGENLIHYGTEQGLPDFGIVHLYRDRKDNIWIGTWEGGLSCWNGKSFTNYQSVKDIGIERVRPMFEDKAGNLWLSSWGKGMSRFNGEKFINYSVPQGLGNSFLYSLAETKDNGILIGTEGSGLLYLLNEKFYHYDSKDGLSNDFITSIEMGKQKDLWIGTSNGLNFLKSTIFSKERIGQQGICKDSFAMNYSFGILDGLKSTGVYQNALCVDSKDRLWVGTNDALSVLDISNFGLPESTPKIQLNSIEIEGVSIDFGLYAKGSRKMQTNDTLSGELLNKLEFDRAANFFNYPLGLKLPHQFNHLSFHFVGIDWVAPHKIVYQYKLEGLENQWSQPGSKNFADYRKIPYGEYIFKVRASGASGKWSDIFEYNFTISPPWWHTWWAHSLFIIAVIVLIAGFIKLRTTRLEREKRILEQKVKARTKEIVKKNMEIEHKNKELQQQKGEIETINEELLQQNEEIQTINTALNEQKEMIEERNTELNAQNEEIRAQRDQLSKQNNSINESILYAERIQSAVLPRQIYIDEILPDNFILFKPRDVVSGDFYWVKQINNYIVIAAADCTGHGVPGAIMSMLGMSFINEIVHKREITQTNYALNELRKHIKHALRQTGKKGEADDGMDMALCALDLKTRKLQFAGAYNPLYLIQDGELIEIKADRMPIGFYPNEKPSFTNHEIQLKDGDIFYLFSDGYIDQFGGKHGFKFKTVNFQKLLLKNHQKPMIIQKELLEQELSNWMKGYDQTDDILVMGVRV